MNHETQEVQAEAPGAGREPAAAPVSQAAASPLLARTFASRRFAVVFGALVVAAVGLNVTVRWMHLFFHKQPVLMTMTFEEALPAGLALGGEWVQIARQDVLDPNLVHSLGTEQFLFCEYVKVKDPQKREELQAKLGSMNLAEQQEQFAELRSTNTTVGLGLTYYSGTLQVAHIPEVCYLGGGFEVQSTRSLTWSWKDPVTQAQRKLDVRFLTFKNPANGAERHVAYLLHVNGRYESDALKVRAILSDLFARRAYYAKVEMSCDGMSPARAEDAMRQLLESLLPEVEKALPVWQQSQ